MNQAMNADCRAWDFLTAKVALLEKEKRELAESLRDVFDWCGEPATFRDRPRWEAAMKKASTLLKKNGA